MERRLAAILVADVVGYSRLMELDEAGTPAALKAHREELINAAIGPPPTSAGALFLTRTPALQALSWSAQAAVPLS